MAVNRRKRGTTVYHVKRGARSVARNVLVSGGLFLAILIISTFFILYQWKEVEVTNCLKANDQLRAEILFLNSQNTRLKTERNELQEQIPQKAQRLLGMIIPVEKQDVVTIDSKKMAFYEAKDRQISE